MLEEILSVALLTLTLKTLCNFPSVKVSGLIIYCIHIVDILCITSIFLAWYKQDQSWNFWLYLDKRPFLVMYISDTELGGGNNKWEKIMSKLNCLQRCYQSCFVIIVIPKYLYCPHHSFFCTFIVASIRYCLWQGVVTCKYLNTFDEELGDSKTFILHNQHQ